MSSDVILKELEGFTLPAFIPKQKVLYTLHYTVGISNLNIY